MADYTFTNDVTGEKFAMDAKVFDWFRENPHAEFIKPVVRAEKKIRWEVWSYSDMVIQVEAYDGIPSDDERLAIVAAIKSLMEFIQTDRFTDRTPDSLVEKANDARKALGGGL